MSHLVLVQLLGYTPASICSSSNLGQLLIPESIVECSDYSRPLLLTSWGNTHNNVCLLMSILGCQYEK
jgi:hypothetical protein